ncbi:MAG: DNA N-6-adenine-methyltransferase [Candidatus Izemoplasmatales bacterium]|nr:DNA N-6-adenine-methyltransferase [Candidatus Izemoplasmatales bacterium]
MMKKQTLDTMFSSGNDEWETPKHIYDFFINRGYEDINPINCKWDALEIKWFDKTFCNPPYSRKLMPLFINKAIEQSKLGKDIILLIPSRTDTKYFHALLNEGVEIIFLDKRLRFSNKAPAPFPSLIIHLNANTKNSILNFQDL